MSAATLPSEPQLRGMRGRCEVAFELRDGETRLSHLYQASPMRSLFPLSEAGDVPQAALVATSGGVVGGDELALNLRVGAGAKARFVAQAAEKIYRSAGPDSRIAVDLNAGPDAWLEYLPQETILFEGARLCRRTRVEAAEGARVLAGEILAFGRVARGERFACGHLSEDWEVRRDGRLIWADRLRLDDPSMELGERAGADGAIAAATLVLLAGKPGRHLDAVRDLLEGRAGATVVNGLLLVRWLARDALALRRNFARVWGALRAAEAGLPSTMPRLWHI